MAARKQRVKQPKVRMKCWVVRCPHCHEELKPYDEYKRTVVVDTCRCNIPYQLHALDDKTGRTLASLETEGTS